LDLCRDASLLPATADAASDAPAVLPKWKCDNALCQAPYDRLAIEERLVSDLQRLVLEWASQDLKCAKCKRLRSNDFMEHCACAGEWVATKDRGEVRRKMGVYARVAEFYGLKMVEGVVEECLEGF
jgi:DNA polymerase epsilon subunit 1